MLDNSWPGWSLAQSAISAGAGLLGVFIGTMMTARNQKLEKQNALIREQLEKFYSPMLGMKAEISAKLETQDEIQSISSRIFKKVKADEGKVDPQESFLEVTSNSMRKLREYDFDQFENQVLPLYEKMLRYFAEHMWLAEGSTRDHYPALIRYVEVWKRHLGFALSPHASWEIDTSDDGLKPLYGDLQMNFNRLTEELRK